MEKKLSILCCSHYMQHFLSVQNAKLVSKVRSNYSVHIRMRCAVLSESYKQRRTERLVLFNFIKKSARQEAAVDLRLNIFETKRDPD